MHKMKYARKEDPNFKLVSKGGKFYEQRTAKCGKVALDDQMTSRWQKVYCRDCWENRSWRPRPNDNYGYKGGHPDDEEKRRKEIGSSTHSAT